MASLTSIFFENRFFKRSRLLMKWPYWDLRGHNFQNLSKMNIKYLSSKDFKILLKYLNIRVEVWKLKFWPNNIRGGYFSEGILWNWYVIIEEEWVEYCNFIKHILNNIFILGDFGKMWALDDLRRFISPSFGRISFFSIKTCW